MKKTTIIIPCAGKSSRYPTVRPKFLLVNPSGNLVLIDSISKLNLKNCSLIVTILEEHNKKYGIEKMLKKIPNSPKISICILDKPTKSQAETVYKTIKLQKIDGPVFIKDCDNIFGLEQIEEKYNYVATLLLKNAGVINASNKSYALNEGEFIKTIREKEVISDTFCVGGYYFVKASDFIETFEKLNNENPKMELYVSMIIRFLIEKKGMKFKTKNVFEYLDLGTINEWLRFKSTIKTYLVDIDGVLVENSGEYSKPLWGKSKGIKENVKVIQKLYKLNNQIILITSRKESYRETTIKQLKKLDIKFHQLIMNVYHSQRILINDFSNSNPYPSALAINIPRDSKDLIKYLNLEKEWPSNER
ncbi:hypothetical protein C4559_02025 [Candidatus Microgenomates bacterium]|nr:MAG: hypothetical protein C4559_02025 [Candidatus Microgenomates bacterium]